MSFLNSSFQLNFPLPLLSFYLSLSCSSQMNTDSIKYKSFSTNDKIEQYKSSFNIFFSCLALSFNVQQALVPFSPSPDAPRCEIATLSVSDSDEDDLIELPSSPKKEIKKSVDWPKLRWWFIVMFLSRSTLFFSFFFADWLCTHLLQLKEV